MTDFVKLRDLTGPEEQDLGQTIERMAELLKSSGETGRVQFRFIDKEPGRDWCLELRGRQGAARAERLDGPNLEVITRAKTWWGIAKGTLSPLDALLQGKLRIRGDAELGKRLLRHLAAAPGRTDPC